MTDDATGRNTDTFHGAIVILVSGALVAVVGGIMGLFADRPVEGAVAGLMLGIVIGWWLVRRPIAHLHHRDPADEAASIAVRSGCTALSFGCTPCLLGACWLWLVL